MTKVSYPKLKIDQKKNSKLTEDDLIQIKKLYKDGISLWEISKMFGVWYQTIKYHCIPEYKEYLRKKVVGYQKDRLKDPIAYRKHLDRDNQLKRDRFKNNPEYRKYRQCVEKRWRKNHPEGAKAIWTKANAKRRNKTSLK